MALDAETVAAVRDATKRVLEGRETVPGDLPYPPSINKYVLLAAWPDQDPQRQQYTKPGRNLTRTVMRAYVAGNKAGRAGDEQIGRQVRGMLGAASPDAAAAIPHQRVGLAVCLVCDQVPDHPSHTEGVTE
jgi:hypothetical protein